MNGNKELSIIFMMKEIKQFEELPHIQFKKKEIYDDFIQNRKYIRISNRRIYTSIDIVIYREYHEFNRCWIEFSLYEEIQRYKNNFDKYSIYYEIDSKKQKIQNAMEVRALNLILQNIIGDKYYTWK